MARGNYWEITFSPNDVERPRWQFAALPTDTGKQDVTIETKEGTRAINLRNKSFRGCDINHFRLKDSSFSRCEFIDCRFIKADFTNVKFSTCIFKKCHFLNVHFEESQFIHCSFDDISMSAEQIRFSSTTVRATHFVQALKTNTAHLPGDKTPQHQEFRLLVDKAKIARSLFLSVRDKPELDLQFEANMCFELAERRKRIEEARWQVTGGKLKKTAWHYRFLWRNCLRLGLLLTKVAGFLTDWGKSPFKSMWLMFLSTALFTAIYIFLFNEACGKAVIRAFDCGLVFGYSKYVRSSSSITGLEIFSLLNAISGCCWYGLLIPTLSKRMFR